MQKVGSASAAERQAAAKEVVDQVKSNGVSGLVVSLHLNLETSETSALELSVPLADL